MSEMEKMDAVMVNMEGDALAWYLYEDNRQPFRSWLRDSCWSDSGWMGRELSRSNS